MSLIRNIFSNIKNVANDIINPATEEKQDNIITELQAIENNQTNWNQFVKPHSPNWVYSDITSDAWGKPKAVLDFSIFHSLFTYNISASYWLTFEDWVEVVTSTRITSIDWEWNIKSWTTIWDTSFLRSKRHPRYQPNRWHLYSTACILPNPTATWIRQIGLKNTTTWVYFQIEDWKVYAVILNNNIEKVKQELDLSLCWLTINDLQYWNLYDIQFQWRWVWDYFFYIDQKLVFKTSFLWNNTSLTITNPALSVWYYCENTDWTEVEIKVWCADITTEWWKREWVVYKTAVTPNEVLINALNKPLIVVRNVKEFLWKPNTRDCLAFRFTWNADQRIIYKAFITRDPTAITWWTYVSIWSDTVLEENITATSVDITKMKQLWVIRWEQYKSQIVDIPSFLVDFYFTEWDYLVFTANRENPTQSALATATVEFWEEI